MNLSEAGESRVRGYLFMLESSLRTFLRRDVAADAVREVESHIRERVRETEPMPNERDALNQLLEALGPPHRLARAYSAEMAVDEAVETHRIVRNRYDAGITTVTEVLRSETALVRARLNHLNARYAHAVGYAGLLLAAGELTGVAPFTQ